MSGARGVPESKERFVGVGTVPRAVSVLANAARERETERGTERGTERDKRSVVG